MNFRFTFLIPLFVSASLQAQPVNLVPNGSFEERIECIWNDSNVKDAPPWFNPMDPTFINQSTPDLFHACAIVNEEPCPYPESPTMNAWALGIPTNFLGCEEPSEGNGYAGAFFFIANVESWLDGYREYLAVRLTEPLQAGGVYDVSMQLSLAERTTHAIWNVQVLLSADSLSQPTTEFMPYEPQLNGTPGDYIDNYDGWREIAWEYTATGGEQFMYIGNFGADSETDTLRTLEGNTFGHYFPATYYFIDDVKVEQNTLSLQRGKKPRLKIYPNPCVDVLTVEGLSHLNATFEVQNLTGQSVLLNSVTNNGILSFDTSDLDSGMYILTLQNQNSFSQYKIVKR